MSGLYQKALKYIQAQKQLRIVKPDELGYEEDLGVSPDDREKILSQINEIVEKNRIVIEPGTFEFSPKKRGGVLPLLFNLAAIVVVAAGGYLLLNYFDRSEASIITSRVNIQSAEGKLLAALKEESEQRLSEKERAISEIQDRLAEMNSEREQLEAEAEAKILEREAELEAAMMRQLEAERARLQSEGLSERDIAARLESFEAEQQAQFDRELAAVRAEARAEIEQQQEMLNQLTSEYEAALSTAEEEKLLLQEEFTRQEASLLADFQKKEAALESERLDALQQLESIRSQQQREQLVLDQILSFYTAVQSHLSAGELDQALASLNELEAYLNQSDVIALEGVGKRRQVELFLIGSLKDLIGEQRRAASPDTRSLINSAKMLAAATDLIEQGNEQYVSADYASARELYVAALTSIPAIGLGYDRLQEMERMETEAESAEIAGIIERANTAYLGGNYAQAVRFYGEALDQMSPIADQPIAANLTQAGYEINRQEDLAAIRNLQELLERQATELEMLETVRAELNNELETLQAQAASDAEMIAGIPALQDRIAGLESQAAADKRELERLPALENRIDELESQLETRISTNQKQQERIALLNTEINRLTARAEKNARELLSLESFKTDVEAERLARTALAEDLRLMKSNYMGGETVTGESDPFSILELLETKLVLRRLASSEPVKSEYPNLYQDIERYIESLVAERESEARLSTLQTLNELLDEALEEDALSESGVAEGTVAEGEPAADAASLQFSSTAEQDAFLALLDRLIKLVE